MNSKGLLEIIQKRRSVRVYKTGKVTEAQLELILEAARWSPSAQHTAVGVCPHL
jgi:nitroreductase